MRDDVSRPSVLSASGSASASAAAASASGSAKASASAASGSATQTAAASEDDLKSACGSCHAASEYDGWTAKDVTESVVKSMNSGLTDDQVAAIVNFYATK